MVGRHAVCSSPVWGVEAGWRGPRAPLSPPVWLPHRLVPIRGVPVTLTVLAGDGNSNVSGEEWSGGMQSAQARSEASGQAGMAVQAR